MTAGPADGLPSLNPDAAAEILAAATPRIDRKAQAFAADLADWKVDGVVVGIGTATVTVDDGVATCDCLLAPRCAHLLALARGARVREGAGGVPDGGGPPAGDDGATSSTLTDAQRDAALAAEAMCAEVLRTGTAELTTPQRGAMLRSVHACRVQGLHRLGAASTALHNALRDPAGSEGAVDALLTTAEAAHVLLRADASGAVTASAIGTARRSYAGTGVLRLQGLACEPVITDSGYAGVVTHLVDADGEGFTLVNVVPGGPSETAAAYRRAAGLGESPMSPAELATGSVLVSGATVSDDRRLGRGKAVRATGLVAEPGEPWTMPLPAGYERVAGAADEFEGGLTIEGLDLAFSASALRSGVGGPPYPHDADVVVLAADGVILAVAWEGNQGWMRWHPGLDRMPPAARDRPAVGVAATDFPMPPVTPTTVLRRWTVRIGRHGVGAVRRDAASLERDTEWLRAAGSPFRAGLLERTAAEARPGGSDAGLLAAWLGCGVSAR